MDEIGVLRGREEGRDGVHMGGQGDGGFSEMDENVVAVRLDGQDFDAPVVDGGERGQRGGEVFTDYLFVAGNGLNVHQGTS